MIQFAPARAKKKIAGPHELHLVEGCLTDQKIDGQRYIIQTRDSGHNCTSRRISEVTQRYVEKGDRVPHLMQVPFPSMSMIDCEFVAGGDILLIDLPDYLWDKLLPHPHMKWLREKFNGQLPVYPHVSETTSIMGSLASEAIRKQDERGHVWAYAFDIIQYMGQSTTKNSQMSRRNFLAKQLMNVDPETGLVLMPCWYGMNKREMDDLFCRVTEVGGEGLVLKDPTKPYNHASAWYKWKKDFPVDAVLTGGYTMGKEGVTNKMAGLIGNLEIGVYDINGDLQPVGQISAIMDSEAKLPELSQRAFDGEVAGLIVECRHNGIQNKPDAPLGYTLRHPRYRRWRDDKNQSDCTSINLLSEISAADVKKYGGR
jgi:ATP-dependent DNA ligase